MATDIPPHTARCEPFDGKTRCEQPNSKSGVLFCGGRKHRLVPEGCTVGKISSDATSTDSPDIKLPNFSIYGDRISLKHGRFIKDENGWRYINLGEHGSRILRNDRWIGVKEGGMLLEDGDQIELGNGADDADGVFEHLFFELE